MNLMDPAPHSSQDKSPEEQKVKKKNLRFKLSLTKTSDNSCPEFSYSDLVKEANKVLQVHFKLANIVSLV